MVSSLVSDAKKKFIDGEEITVNQAIGHAACQAAAAASAALAGGAVAKALSTGTQSTQTATAKAMVAVKSAKAQATATSISEVAIDKPYSATLPDQAKGPGQKVLVPLTKKATETANQKAAELVEHSKLSSGSTKTPSFGENNVDLQDCTPNEVDAILNIIDTGKPLDGTIRYISEGFWFSRMVVSYILNGKPVEQVKRGNGSQIKITSNAKEIKVRFQVLRPPWGDISKYDRFKGCWCQPYEPHVFHYESPPTRTFIISGPLYWEAVMGVNDEHHNETNEM